MLKYIVSLLVSIAALLPAQAQTPSVQSGRFEDGATLYWQCQPDMRGKVIIGFVSPQGDKYQAVVDCLHPAKNPQDI